jgi:DNA-damage-inducible protein J
MYWRSIACRDLEKLIGGNCIMPTKNINIRADSEIKSKAQEIFNSLGLDMSTAINLFLRQTVRHNDLPFILSASIKSNKTTRNAMFGYLRGEYKIESDFDAPLDDFKEYMK